MVTGVPGAHGLHLSVQFLAAGELRLEPVQENATTHHPQETERRARERMKRKNRIYLATKKNAHVRFCFHYLSHHMEKPTICIGENKGADQLRSY